MQLGTAMAVAVVQEGSCSSNVTLAWELPYATVVAVNRRSKKKKKKKSCYLDKNLGQQAKDG